MVVPALTRAHSRLVSGAWNPRTTCRRAYRGRLSAVVSTAMIKGVWPRRPRPEPSPVRSPPITLTADVGVVDLDPRPAGAKLIAAVPLDHRLHQFMLNSPGSIGRNPKSPAQLDVRQPFLALGEQMHGAEPYP